MSPINPITPIPPAIARIAPDGNLTPRQKRRFLIGMSLRRQKPGAGSGHDFMRRRTADILWPDLREILHDIPWVIVGGVATRAYMPERVTRDLDILVRYRDGKDVIDRLKQASCTIVSRLAMPGYLMRSPQGIDLDVIFGQYRWTEEALTHPEQDPAGYPVIGLPYLILMKMAATRAQDWADISRMLGWASDEDLDKVRAVVARYSPEDSGDLESLIFIGQKERQMPPDSE